MYEFFLVLKEVKRKRCEGNLFVNVTAMTVVCTAYELKIYKLY